MNENYNNKYNMKTKEDIKFATVGKLLKELKRIESFDEECTYYCPTVFVSNVDELYFGMVGLGPDEDGDLRIELEEMGTSEGFFDVQDLILRLKEFDSKTKVYLAGGGLYLNLDQDGDIFSDPDEEDSTVGCYASIFGNYTPEPKPEINEEQPGPRFKKEKGNKREQRGETIVLGAITLGLFCLLIYNVYALIARVDEPMWEKIIWILVSAILIILNTSVLYRSKH